MAGANLRESQLMRDFGQPRLVIGKVPAMQQHDGERIDASLAQSLQIAPHRTFVQHPQHFAIRANAFVNLDHMPLQPFGQHDMARKDVGPRLIADAQRIAVSGGNRQCDLCPLSFEQGIGGNRRADPQFGNRCLWKLRAMLSQNPPHRLTRSVGIVFGIAG